MIITHGLINNAQFNPNNLAVIDGSHRYSYHTLAERTAKLKAALKKKGVNKGDCVGILMLNSHRYLELFYAITAIGAIAVPLNIRLSLPELEFIIKDSGLEILFIQSEFLHYIPYFKENAEGIKEYIVADDEKTVGGHSLYEQMIKNESVTKLTHDDVDENDVAFLIYTGGTTGRSKGVMLSHRNLLQNYFNGLIGKYLEFSGNFLYSNPMYHLGGCSKIIAVMSQGRTHSFLKTFTPKGFLQAVQDYQVTDVTLVPTMLNMVVNEPEFNKYDVSSIKTLAYGASPMPVELIKKVYKAFPGVELYQAYGMTEASPVLTVLGPQDHVIRGDEKQERRLASAGRNVQGVEVRVVTDDGKDVNVGQVGEVIARGSNIMKGYWKLPEETALAIRNGWYYTGDMATVDEDGYIYIVDRKKDMIISGGVNIYSIEVENAIYTHPDVIEVAVIGVPDEKWGEAVKAFVVKKQDSQLTEQLLTFFIRKTLARFKVPKSIEFIDELPKSGAGKILKRSLRTKFLEQTQRI
ncbi:class I adenylate-forming enzyme family protein [Peribacillus frigoritolerans]|uniref:class I adenylate-forming enzyme family protein n=1 Tax=Peribacillus frigoritolerans TaxID=450367 RepID=UPI0020C10868|nr:long-chain fatty acid--CoA ligase [Peribacillus frigoritolerans]